jgi:hypothetical protein
MNAAVPDQITAVEKALDDLRYTRSDPTCPEHAAYNLLRDYAAELRASTPKEISRVLLAMTDQVNRAKKHRAQFGFYDVSHAQTICNSLCGRWWPVVSNAVAQYEKETAGT